MEAGSEHRTAGAAGWRPVLGILLGIYIGYAGWELLPSGRASASPLSFALWAVSVSNLSLIQSSAVAGAAGVPRRLAWTAAMAAGAALLTSLPADPFWTVLTVPLLIAAAGRLWSRAGKSARSPRPAGK